MARVVEKARSTGNDALLVTERGFAFGYHNLVSDMLLDEPFAGIDPIAVVDIQGIVTQLKKRGIGVLITDHNVRETLGICDRAYIVNEGAVLEEGIPSCIAESPVAREIYLGDKFRL